MIEFLRYRFAFNSSDFEERVTAAAVKLGLVEGNDLDEDETADLVELTADGVIDEPRSTLGRYLVRHWEVLLLVNGESLVYWLRKLVFRGAWLDQHVKEGLLDVDFDDRSRRVRLPRPARRPAFARAGARAELARAAVPALAQPVSDRTPEFSSPDDLAAPAGYSHVVSIPAGRLVWTSGQVPMDADRSIASGQGGNGRRAWPSRTSGRLCERPAPAGRTSSSSPCTSWTCRNCRRSERSATSSSTPPTLRRAPSSRSPASSTRTC